MPHLDEYNFSALAELHSFSALVSDNFLFLEGFQQGDKFDVTNDAIK